MNRNRNYIRRVLIMCFAIFIMGLGIALFKVSLMGNDPCSAFTMSLAAKLGMSFSRFLIILNTFYFAVEFLWGRKYIGIGTFVNWVFVGIFTDFFAGTIEAIWIIPEAFLPRLPIMLAGILILSLAASMYQTSDVGIAPYDSLSIILSDRFPIPYFWCRIFTDSLCALGAFLLGGIVGLGTLVCALGLGPFIQYFNVHVSEKLCGKYAAADEVKQNQSGTAK